MQFRIHHKPELGSALYGPHEYQYNGPIIFLQLKSHIPQLHLNMVHDSRLLKALRFTEACEPTCRAPFSYPSPTRPQGIHDPSNNDDSQQATRVFAAGRAVDKILQPRGIDRALGRCSLNLSCTQVPRPS